MHLGPLALGVEPGDVVITPTLIFAATANAIVYTGAEPCFIDVDPMTGNLDPRLLECALTELRSNRERVGAILPVDLLGKAANYTEIEHLARKLQVSVLADAAESLGASHHGRAQLSRLDEMIARRRDIRDRYRELFAAVPGVRIFGGEYDLEDNCWLTAIIVDPEITGWTTFDLCEALEADGIENRPLWKPMHLQQVFGTARGKISGTAQRLYETGLTLPSGSAMTQTQFERVLERLRAFVHRARRP